MAKERMKYYADRRRAISSEKFTPGDILFSCDINKLRRRNPTLIPDPTLYSE